MTLDSLFLLGTLIALAIVMECEFYFMRQDVKEVDRKLNCFLKALGIDASKDSK